MIRIEADIRNRRTHYHADCDDCDQRLFAVAGNSTRIKTKIRKHYTKMHPSITEPQIRKTVAKF